MVIASNMVLETESPTPALYGILSPAVTVIEHTEESWISGFIYENLDAGARVSNYTIAGANPIVKTDPILVDSTFPLYRQYYPFDVRLTMYASTMDHSPEKVLEEAKVITLTAMQKAIESEFWSGILAQATGSRGLVNSTVKDVTPTPGTAVKPRYGQALLEQALGDATIGSRGVIHANRQVASVLKVKDVKGALMTNLGTKVVSGVGYDGLKGPNGTTTTPGKAWMYATGPITVHLGPLTITPQKEKPSQAVDTLTNFIVYYVDRPVSVTWSTSTSQAVLVDLSLDYA